MVPLIVVTGASLLARIWRPWPEAIRIGLAAMFVVTGASHFGTLKHDLAAMIPPPLTGSLAVIHLTGVLEIAGAIALLLPRWTTLAAWCLIALLVAMFPANVYAAMQGLRLNGELATPLVLRAPLQLLFIALLWWSSARNRTSHP